MSRMSLELGQGVRDMLRASQGWARQQGGGHRPRARESEEASWMAGRVPTELRERITLDRGRLGEQARRQKPVPTVQESWCWGLNGWGAGKEEF